MNFLLAFALALAQLGINNPTPNGPIAGVSLSGGLSVVAQNRLAAQTAAIPNIFTYTTSADSTFLVVSYVSIPAACTCSFNVITNYTDPDCNCVKNHVSAYLNNGGSLLTNPSITTGTNIFQGFPNMIRAKSGTNIVASTQGTFTSVTYGVQVALIQCTVCL